MTSFALLPLPLFVFSCCCCCRSWQRIIFMASSMNLRIFFLFFFCYFYYFYPLSLLHLNVVYYTNARKREIRFSSCCSLCFVCFFFAAAASTSSSTASAAPTDFFTPNLAFLDVYYDYEFKKKRETQILALFLRCSWFFLYLKYPFFLFSQTFLYDLYVNLHISNYLQ